MPTDDIIGVMNRLFIEKPPEASEADEVAEIIELEGHLGLSVHSGGGTARQQVTPTLSLTPTPTPTLNPNPNPDPMYTRAAAPRASRCTSSRRDRTCTPCTYTLVCIL